MTITDFLLARITEDELEVGPADPDEGAGPNGIGWAEVGALNEVLLARPSRVLAECEAKRQIVDLATNQHISSPDLDEAVRVLTSVYADHPDYDPAWRPA